MNVERRTVLQLTGIAAVGGLVVACSSGTEASTGGSSGASAAPGSAAPASSAAGGSGALAATSDIPVGGGVILADEAIVITQPTEGDFKAFSAVCTHQGCLVGTVSDNTITCPCHGSQYSATDGSVITGPATSPLTSAGITVENGSVVLS